MQPVVHAQAVGLVVAVALHGVAEGERVEGVGLAGSQIFQGESPDEVAVEAVVVEHLADGHGVVDAVDNQPVRQVYLMVLPRPHL